MPKNIKVINQCGESVSFVLSPGQRYMVERIRIGGRNAVLTFRQIGATTLARLLEELFPSTQIKVLVVGDSIWQELENLVEARWNIVTIPYELGFVEGN